MVCWRRQIGDGRINVVTHHNRRHADAAIGAGWFDAVDVVNDNLQVGVDVLGYVVGRDVFAFPAKGVADSADKLIVFFAKTKIHVDCFHQAAAVETHVTADRCVLDAFFSWRLSIGIALKFDAVCHLNQKQGGLSATSMHRP